MNDAKAKNATTNGYIFVYKEDYERMQANIDNLTIDLTQLNVPLKHLAIIWLLRNTNLIQSKIGKIVDMNHSSISRTNSGERYKQEGIEYPIREKKGTQEYKEEDLINYIKSLLV